MHVDPQAFHPCHESHVAMTDTFQVSPGLIAGANAEEHHGTKGQTPTAVPPSPWQAATSPKSRSGWQMGASIPMGSPTAATSCFFQVLPWDSGSAAVVLSWGELPAP